MIIFLALIAEWAYHYFIKSISDQDPDKTEDDTDIEIPQDVYNQNLDPNLSYKFDVFIMHGKDLEEWIEINSINILQPKWNVALPCHFIPGKPIAENIIDFVENSNKIVILMTKESYVDEWESMYTFHQAHFMRKLKMRQDDLIVASKNEEIPQMTKELQHFLEMNVRPKNIDDPNFWDSLDSFIGKNTEKASSSTLSNSMSQYI